MRHRKMRMRVADEADAAALVDLINTAYVVEAFFKRGDRTNHEAVLRLMAKGRFLLLDEPDRLAGCVYVEVNDRRGYFGMLSIHPARQRRGLGATLIDAAEEFCRAAGCNWMELQVVNLRGELLRYYRKLGYTEAGTREFPLSDGATRPCHFIVMRKTL